MQENMIIFSPRGLDLSIDGMLATDPAIPYVREVDSSSIIRDEMKESMGGKKVVPVGRIRSAKENLTSGAHTHTHNQGSKPVFKSVSARARSGSRRNTRNTKPGNDGNVDDWDDRGQVCPCRVTCVLQ